MIELTTKVDKLQHEKTQVRDSYHKQLQGILQEKEELVLAQAGLDDKLQKIELDREQLKLKAKQTGDQLELA